MIKNYIRRKVFEYDHMPAEVKDALRETRKYAAFFNDICVKFGMEHGPNYPIEQNMVYDWLITNGATNNDREVIIEISW